MKVQEREPGKIDFISPFPADVYLTFNYTECIFWFAVSGMCSQVSVDVYT